MPYDVTLPNGTIVENVPDDMNKYGLMERVIRGGLATAEDFGHKSGFTKSNGEYTEDIGPTGSFGENLLVGLDRGITHTGMQLGNMLGMVSDSEIDEAEALDKALLNTWGGGIGNVAGELIATAPIGAGVGTAGKALTAAAATGNAARATKAGAAVLGNRYGRAAVEGTGYGAIFGGPDNRLGGAALGAGFGLGVTGLGHGLGALWQQAKVGILPEAKALMEKTGMFIPLSQSGTGMVRNVYNGILANLPGGSTTIRRQYKDAVDDLRQWAGTQAHPDDEFARVVIAKDDDIHTIFTKLDDYWKGNKEKGLVGAYDEIGTGVMNASKVKVNKVTRDAINARAKEVGLPYRIPSGEVSVQKVLNLRNAITELKMATENSQFTRGLHSKFDKTLKNIDDQLESQLSPDAWRQYSALRPAYANYNVLKGAVDKAKSLGQEFTPQQLLTAAAEKGGAGARSGGNALQQTADEAMRALPDFPSREGIFQIVASLGLAGKIFAGVGLPVVPTLSALGVGRLMATKGFQEFLMGGHRGAELIAKPMFQQFLKVSGYSARQQAAIKAQILQEEGEK